MLEPSRFGSAIVPCTLSHPPQHILVGSQAFKPHWPARMELARADPHLRAEAVAEPICKTCAGVMEDTGRIDLADETLGIYSVLGQYCLGMRAAVPVDMSNTDRGHCKCRAFHPRGRC